MFEVVILLCLAAPPRQAPLPPQAPLPLPPQAPVYVSTGTCPCGTACPMGGGCGAACDCSKTAGPRHGEQRDGWTYNAHEDYWWRYGSALVAQPRTVTYSPLPTYTAQPLFNQGFRGFQTTVCSGGG